MFRNRWVRRAAIGLGIAFVAWAAFLIYSRYATQREGEERLAAVVAELDASDSRWRFADLESSRGHLPDEQNSALLVPKFTAALRTPKLEAVRPDGKLLLFDGPPNRWLDDEAYAAIDRALDGNDRALGVARSFKDRPRGLRRLTISPDFIGTFMPHLQETRVIFTALDLDAERLARAGRPGMALQHVPAMVHAARSFDGEPMLMSALVRMAGDQMAARRAERVLALGQAKGGLWAAQGALGREAEADVFWPALRGERAGVDEMFRNLESGLLPVGRYLEALDMADPAGSRKKVRRPELVEEVIYSPNLPGDHARYLEFVTRACEVGKLPEHEQRKAMAAALAEPVGPGHRFTRLLTGGGYAKLHETSLRTRALLRCATVGLAVERCRLRDGHWPDSLAEVPQDILSAIPPDPFDGKPLRYARRDDWVTVYSIGPDEKDDGGRAVDGEEAKAPGTDVCFRLYEPKARGLPALPRPRLMDVPESGVEMGPVPREVDER
jgi:hypothetical protein